jgi:hypothetical protein
MWAGQFVADISDRNDIFGAPSIMLDFVAKMADMYVDDSRIAEEMIIPYPMQQLLSAQHFAAVAA